MGQFYKTTDPRRIDFMNKIPADLMFKVAQFKQKQDDVLASETFKLHGVLDNLQTHQQWSPALKEKVDKYNTLIDNLSREINNNPGNYQEKMGMIRQLSRDLSKELQSGDLGYMVNHFKNYQNKVKELRKNKNLNQTNVDLALSKYQKDLASQDYFYDKNTGSGSSPSLAFLTKDFDTQKYLKDNIDPKNFEKYREIWNKHGIQKVGGQLVFTNTKTTVTDKQAMEIAAKELLSGNQEFKDYNRMLRGLRGTPDYSGLMEQSLERLNSLSVEDYYPGYDDFTAKQKKAAEKQFNATIEAAKEDYRNKKEYVEKNGVDAFDDLYKSEQAASAFSKQFNASKVEIDKKFAKDNSYLNALDRAKLRNKKLSNKKLEKELEEMNNIGFVTQQTLYKMKEEFTNENYVLKNRKNIAELNKQNQQLGIEFNDAKTEREKEIIKKQIKLNTAKITQLGENKKHLYSVGVDAINQLNIPKNIKKFYSEYQFLGEDVRNVNSNTYEKFLIDNGLDKSDYLNEWMEFNELAQKTFKEAQINYLDDANKHSQNTIQVFNFTNKLGTDKKGLPTSTPTDSKYKIKSVLQSIFTPDMTISDMPVYDSKKTTKVYNFNFKDLTNGNWELIGRAHPNSLMSDGVKVGIKKDGKIVQTVLLDLSNFSNLSENIDKIMKESKDDDASEYIKVYGDNTAREQTSYLQKIDRAPNHKKGRPTVEIVNEILTKTSIRKVGDKPMYDITTDLDAPNEKRFLVEDPKLFANINSIQNMLRTKADEAINALKTNPYIKIGNVAYDHANDHYYYINNQNELGDRLDITE